MSAQYESIKNIGYFEGSVFWFAYGRQALERGLQLLGLSKGDNVLVPEYICNVIISAFHDLGINIAYYRIKKDLIPDFNDAEKRINGNTKAFLCVNYFGFPCPHDAVREFCDYHRLFFIEDNAHGFFSKYKGIWLGMHGDISITSIRKSLPIPHGAILRVKNETAAIAGCESMKRTYSVRRYILVYYLKRLMSLFIKQIMKHNDSEHRRYWINSSHHMPDHLMDIQCNYLIPRIVQATSYERFYAKRIKRYREIIKFIEDQKIFTGRLLYKKIPEGIIPLQIPVVINKQGSGKRDILEVINRSGMSASYWPDLPEEIIAAPDQYHIANYYKNNLIHFLVNA